MDVVHVNVPLRTGKKMKKRKELDALVANSIAKRSCGGGGGAPVVNKRCTAGNGVSSQDQLLSESTDEQEAYWNVSGDAINKRPRNIHHVTRRRTLLSLVRACTALLVLTCVIATITVMWLLIDLREQITSLRSELDQVVASNQGVPEALQKCHSMSRALQQNQSQLAIQLNGFQQQLDNFTQQVNDIKDGLNKLQQRLKENPDLVTIPREVSVLSNSVAGFGSQLKDVSTTMQSIKDQNTKFTSTISEIVQNITTVQATVSQVMQNNLTTSNNLSAKTLLAEKQEIMDQITLVKNNISLINETLTNKLQWVADDYHKDHKLIEGLQESNQSIHVRIKSLEDNCNKITYDQNSTLFTIRNLSQQLEQTAAKAHNMNTDLMTLQATVRDLNSKMNEQNILNKQIATSNLIKQSPSTIIPPTTLSSVDTTNITKLNELQSPPSKPNLLIS